MKKLLLSFILLYSGYSYAQIFKQDFNASNSQVDNKSNTATPNIITNFSNYANAPAAIVDINTSPDPVNNVLQWDKKGTSGIMVSRLDDIVTPQPNFMITQFKVNVKSPTTFNNYSGDDITFYIGDGTDEGWSNRTQFKIPIDAETHTKFSIKLNIVNSPSSAAFSIVGDATQYSGWQTITLVTNNSGAKITYNDPLGATSDVDNDKFDVWVGTDLVINGAAAITPTVALAKFKLICPANAPNMIFQIDDITVFDDETTVLPVTFTSFSGETTKNTNQLSWTTASEENNSHFEIYRAGDDREFRLIYSMKGVGNSNQVENYRFTDYNPLYGNNYYKIKQIDYDGKIMENPVIVSLFLGKSDGRFYAVMAEAGDVLNIYFDSSKKIKDKLKIIDMNGRIIHQQDVNLQIGQNFIEISSSFQKGLYVANLSAEKLSIKFIK